MKFKLLIALATMASSTVGFAQTWPSKPVTLIVATSPGGVADSVARALAEEMAKRVGQPVIVENRTGAAGMIAAQTVARSNPDGHTLLVTTSSTIMNAPLMFTKVPYDVKRDLSFVTQISAGQILFTVNAEQVPAKSMKEFIAWAAKNKGKVSYGSYGVGTVGHLVGAYLSESRALDMTHIAYKGEAPMVQDMLGGQIAWGISSAGTTVPHIKSGKLRALAVIGGRRIKDLPDVPTMSEAGMTEPELGIAGWVGMLAPSGTPAPVLESLEKVVRAAVQTTPMKARFQVYAMEPIGNSSSDFRRDVEVNMPVYERLIKTSGVKPQ